MLEENQEIIVKCINNKIKEYYKSKGYKIDKTIKVKAEDLMPGSNKKVRVICDYCGKKYELAYINYYKHVLCGVIHKCACSECDYLKLQETLLNKYGLNNVGKLEKTRQKAKETCLKKYGTDNPMKVKEICDKQHKVCYLNNGYISPFEKRETQAKAIDTRRNKYGVDYIMQSQYFQNKTQNSLEQKYGVRFPFQSDIIRNKIENIFQMKYGGKSPLIDDGVLSKVSFTRFLNDTCIKSDVQDHLAYIFNGISNFPIGRYNVDILLDNNIVLEYDGGGHALGIKLSHLSLEDFNKHENFRNNYIINLGYKIIKFKNNNDDKYNDDEYLSALNLCLKEIENNNYVEYDFSNKKINSLTYCN